MDGWWSRKPMRMIQTNLREIDVNLDVEQYVQSLKDFAANVVLLNVGGIVAHYPTRFAFHYRNPYLTNDFVGEAVRLLRQADIRVIARFDFSKLNESIAARHPDWLYRSPAGRPIVYNGQVHACLNGAYQQVHSIEILREAAEAYEIDGVFFNYFGYHFSDYSGRSYGICQCRSCLARFRGMFGHARLPVEENRDDPVYSDYKAFQQATIEELFLRRRAAVKEINGQIAVCNRTHFGSDIYRDETNSSLTRPLPEHNYSTSEHVKRIRGTWPSLTATDMATHFVADSVRHVGVSRHLTAARLTQSLVQGSWLDFGIIGALINQEDRECLEQVRSLYRFHREHEDVYADLESLADICLIHPSGSQMFGSLQEFRGLLRILAEHHLLYDIIDDSALDAPDIGGRLNKYQAIILPDARCLNERACRHLDDYVRAGGKLLATGAAATYDAKGRPLHRFGLSSVGVERIAEELPERQGCYFRVGAEAKAVLRGFEHTDILYLQSRYLRCRPKPDARGLLEFVPPGMFGPPEKCYYTEITDACGLISYRYGRGATALLPWLPGRHYERLSHPGHASLIASVLKHMLEVRPRADVETSPLVETTAHRSRNGTCLLLHLVNLSGQLGTSFHAPIPLTDITVRLKTEGAADAVFALVSAAELDFRAIDEETVEFTVPRLESFETIRIHIRK